MQAHTRQSLQVLAERTPRSSRLPRYLATALVGCLLKVGAVMALPAPPAGDTTGTGGTISFSGAVVVATCPVGAPVITAGTSALAQARGTCHDAPGEIPAAYRASVADLGDHPAIPLLEYAKATYSKAVLVTYAYE